MEKEFGKIGGGGGRRYMSTQTCRPPKNHRLQQFLTLTIFIEKGEHRTKRVSLVKLGGGRLHVGGLDPRTTDIDNLNNFEHLTILIK